jgi:hypothetical protein
MIELWHHLSIVIKENFVYAAPGHHLLKKYFFTAHHRMPEPVRVLFFQDSRQRRVPHGKE